MRLPVDTSPPILEVEGLSVDIDTPAGWLHAVSDVDFAVRPAETLCLVGESGCGKTMTSLAVTRLLPPKARLTARRLAFDGVDLMGLGHAPMARLRGDRIGMIFQDPMTSLNPVLTIGDQLEEVFLRHRGGARAAARERAIYLLDRCGVSAASQRLGQYPHELSGGLRQRMMIAMMLMCEPALLIADEPTTALDVTVQLQILKLLRDLQAEMRMALVLITHSLGVVAHMADRIAVMYAGQIVETGTPDTVFARPQHPYTRGLLASVPRGAGRANRLGAIAGVVPALTGETTGCSFRNRCPDAMPICALQPIGMRTLAEGRAYRCLLPANTLPVDSPARTDAARPGMSSPDASAPVIEARGIACVFQIGRWPHKPRPLHAVDDVSLRVRRGEVMAIVGESGCGKTTLSRILLGLRLQTAGEVLIEGAPVASFDPKRRARMIQPIFQDPYSSLNPRRTIAEIIGDPLVVHGIGTATQRSTGVRAIMERVGLPHRLAHSYPSQLSGGQRQRVAIARALVVKPDILVCDEPTSALDVSVQAQVLNLLKDLRDQLGLTYIFISHDLSVVEFIADRIAVMYLGRVVECGPAAQVLERPRHPYTEALLRSVLTPVAGASLPDANLGSGAADPLNPPSGCRFHPRCPRGTIECEQAQPPRHGDVDDNVECLHPIFAH